MQVNTIWKIVPDVLLGPGRDRVSVGQQKDIWRELPIMNYILSEPQSHKIRHVCPQQFIVRLKRYIQDGMNRARAT